jgi:enoyl-CoA hydratase/carnithine racemase
VTNQFFQIDELRGVCVVRLESSEGTNRLTRACLLALTAAVRDRTQVAQPLVITGSEKYFSVGADLGEIAVLHGTDAYKFSQIGQALMNLVAQFPAPVYAAISGYCMGGGLDLALACHRRIASPHSVFGHRGAALGLITGWGGTQRLPRLVGKAKALELFVAAEKLHAPEAFRIGLVDAIVADPEAEAVIRIRHLLDARTAIVCATA